MLDNQQVPKKVDLCVGVSNVSENSHIGKKKLLSNKYIS